MISHEEVEIRFRVVLKHVAVESLALGEITAAGARVEECGLFVMGTDEWRWGSDGVKSLRASWRWPREQRRPMWWRRLMALEFRETPAMLKPRKKPEKTSPNNPNST